MPRLPFTSGGSSERWRKPAWQCHSQSLTLPNKAKQDAATTGDKTINAWLQFDLCFVSVSGNYLDHCASFDLLSYGLGFLSCWQPWRILIGIFWIPFFYSSLLSCSASACYLPSPGGRCADSSPSSHTLANIFHMMGKTPSSYENNHVLFGYDIPVFRMLI